MKGLLKNNCFATLDNAKAITGLMVLLCVLGIVMKNQSLIISFTLICMVKALVCRALIRVSGK